MRRALSSLAGPGAEAALELFVLVGELEVVAAHWQQGVAGAPVAVVYVTGLLPEVVEGVVMAAVHRYCRSAHELSAKEVEVALVSWAPLQLQVAVGDVNVQSPS